MNRLISYSLGLFLALVLTIGAFSIVAAQNHAYHGMHYSIFVIPAILLLAMAQLVVQLIFFLHLGQDKSAQWNTALFSFTFFGILTIVLASVWIMGHLNNNMTPVEVNQYIINQSGF